MPGNAPILIAEDEPDDVCLIEMAFCDLHPPNPVQVVKDGDQAIQYLAGEGQFSDRAAYPFPALLLLDLKMPQKDGFEVLHWLNQHPAIKARLPAIVLTSFDDPKTEHALSELGVGGYLRKEIRRPQKPLDGGSRPGAGFR